MTSGIEYESDDTGTTVTIRSKQAFDARSLAEELARLLEKAGYNNIVTVLSYQSYVSTDASIEVCRALLAQTK